MSVAWSAGLCGLAGTEVPADSGEPEGAAPGVRPSVVWCGVWCGGPVCAAWWLL